jgi:hypothetical protein
MMSVESLLAERRSRMNYMALAPALPKVKMVHDLMHTNALKLGRDLQWKEHVVALIQDRKLVLRRDLHLVEVLQHLEQVECHREDLEQSHQV